MSLWASGRRAWCRRIGPVRSSVAPCRVAVPLGVDHGRGAADVRRLRRLRAPGVVLVERSATACRLARGRRRPAAAMTVSVLEPSASIDSWTASEEPLPTATRMITAATPISDAEHGQPRPEPVGGIKPDPAKRSVSAPSGAALAQARRASRPRPARGALRLVG